MGTKIRAFIGSSGAGKSIAHAFKQALGDRVNATLWYDGSYKPSATTIEALEDAAQAEIDLAVLVLTPDDVRDRGTGSRKVARDNVLFELGLFMGALGRNRTFGLLCQHCEVDLPTDLLGVTWLTYLHPHHGGDLPTEPIEALQQLTVALGPAADKVALVSPGGSSRAIRTIGSEDLVKAYPMRGLVGRLQWNKIIDGSQRNIWLYGMAELGYAEDDQVPTILERAARQGCEIRVLLLDPAYEGISDIDIDEMNPPGTLAARTRSALSRFARMSVQCDSRMRIRIYSSSPMVSMVRGDDRMLVTPYVRFLLGNNSPTFELQDLEESGMFRRYAQHFEKNWVLAREWTNGEVTVTDGVAR